MEPASHPLAMRSVHSPEFGPFQRAALLSFSQSPRGLRDLEIGTHDRGPPPRLVPPMLRRVTRLPRAPRARALSSRAEPSPELLSGLPLLASTLWRCAQKYPSLAEWEDRDLVPSTLSAWDRHRLFLLVNTPARLDFEAEPFLAGAKVAIEQLIRATKSREFADFVERQQESEVVDRVRAFCTPRGFSFHEDATKQALAKKMIVEAEHVEVESVQLNECVYGQVSEAEFQQELRGKRRVINEITEDATLERLFVSVKATVNERLRRELVGEEVQTVEQKNVYFAVLASNVTTPEAVDWAFVANVLGNTLRSNEISRSKLSSSGIDPADSKPTSD